MSDNNISDSAQSIDIEAIEDGDVLHLESKYTDAEDVYEVKHAGHAMVWLENDKRLFYEDAGEKWTYEGIAAKVTRVHGGSGSPWADLFAGESPADNR